MLFRVCLRHSEMIVGDVDGVDITSKPNRDLLVTDVPDDPMDPATGPMTAYDRVVVSLRSFRIRTQRGDGNDAQNKKLQRFNLVWQNVAFYIMFNHIGIG